ncbi:MAG: tRNA lysidine(34) synthetase TilS, partial [Verrucomicrobiota bacterium]
AGMEWHGNFPCAKELKLVRPLLDLEKVRLLEYAKQQQVPYREDATNKDTEILRNRIRKKLIPYVTTQFGEATMSAVSRTMEVVGAEADLVKQATVEWMRSKRRKSFARLHLAVQRQVIRQQLWGLGVQESFDLVEVLRGQAGIWMQVDAGTFLCRLPSGLVERRAPQDTGFHQATRPCALSEALGNVVFASLAITWERSKAPKVFSKPERMEGLEVFDADKVGAEILLRHWWPGDRFQPLGMPQPVKLQDWFVNRKVPMERRRQLVLAETADGRIFWVEGERIGEQFKLDKASRQRLKWQWQAVSSP